MKKLLFILLAMLTMNVSFISCGSDDDDDIYEAPIRTVPTITEIQGTWGFESQSNYYYSFTFTDNKFTFGIYNTKLEKLKEYAGGTFTITDGKLCLKRSYGDSMFTAGNIYWPSSLRNELYIAPIGVFMKVK